MSSPRVSIIIPCRNEAAHIEQLLEALARQDFKDFEILIAEGGSTDSTPALVKRYAIAHPDLSIRLIHNSAGTIPAGLNGGIQAAVGEVIVRLDGHSRPAPDYLSRCLEALQNSGETVVGGAWNVQAGAPSVIAEAIAGAVSSRLGAGDALYRLSSATQACEVDTVPFGCFYRRTWEQLGGYNEALLSNEDYEFNRRARLSGGRIYFDPQIRCDYFARASFPELAQQYARYGWWKAQMLKRDPGSLRLRQAVPIGWTGGSLFAGMLAGLIPSLHLAGLLLWSIYFTVLLLGAGSVTLHRRQGVRFWFALVVAYLVIHYSWGLGAWWGLLPGHRLRPEKVFVTDY